MFLINQLKKLNTIVYSDLVFVQYEAPAIKPVSDMPIVRKEKQPKGASHRDTLHFFREGKSIEEIAHLRNLALGTIESHLASFIYTGQIELNELVAPKRSAVILEVITDAEMPAGAIKQLVPDDYSFAEIRAVMNWYRLQNEKKDQPA